MERMERMGRMERSEDIAEDTPGTHPAHSGQPGWNIRRMLNTGGGAAILLLLLLVLLAAGPVFQPATATWELPLLLAGKLLLAALLTGVLLVFNRRWQQEQATRQQLVQENEQLRADFQTSFEQAIVGIYQTFPDTGYVRANKAMARMFGFATPEELVEIVYLDNNKNGHYVDPNRRQEFLAAIQQQDTLSHFVSQAYRKDGSIFWILEHAQVVRDAEGRVRYYLGYIQDSTAQKETEEQFRRSLEQQKALLDALPDLMFRVNTSGMLVNYKPAKDRFASPVQHLPTCPQPLHDAAILPPATVKQALAHLREALATNQTRIFEYQQAVGNETHDYEVRMVVSGSDEVLALVRDISERKRAERLKNEFISIVSHELRTPLTSIRGSLGLLAGGVAGTLTDESSRMVQIAYKNSERLVTLVNDILDIDKIESGQMVFNLKPADLPTLVQQAIEDNQGYAEQYNVQFAYHSSLEEARVHIDQMRLLQVMANLLSNAAKFSPSGGTVEITLARHDNHLRVSITDHGPGVPPEFRSRIFQRFAQADSSDTRKKSGSGLGLSITKGIIEKMGGRIGFKSEPDVATTFFFELPEWRAVVSDSSKPRILICEDTPDLAMMLSMILSHGGFVTDVAYNSDQARQFLSYNHYAAMTLDLVMPGQDGISFIRELRGQERTRNLPIVVVSALAGMNQETLSSATLEVADWLDKPIDAERLLGAVDAAMRRQTSGRPRILHVEDDPDVIAVVAAILRPVADMTQAASIAEARHLLEPDTFDLVILDMHLPDGSGVDILHLIRSSDRLSLPVVIFAANETNSDIASQVDAVLVKSRTSNTDLLGIIQSLVQSG